ncbi:hypothetical protein ACFL1B_02060 [Nanoarchaeota archaeon]
MTYIWGVIREYAYKRKNLLYFHIAMLFFVVMLALIFRQKFLVFMLLLVLYIIDIIFDIFLRFTLRPIYRTFPVGIELVTFNTVVAAIALGPIAGVICGLIFGMTYYGIIFSFNSTYQLINIPAYGLLGYLAASLPISSMVWLGVILSGMYALVTSIFILFFFGGRIEKCLIFIISNVMFNYWVFTHASPIVLNIIGV